MPPVGSVTGLLGTRSFRLARVVCRSSINPVEMAIISNSTTSQLRLRWRAPINSIASRVDVTTGRMYMDTRSAKKNRQTTSSPKAMNRRPTCGGLL